MKPNNIRGLEKIIGMNIFLFKYKYGEMTFYCIEDTLEGLSILKPQAGTIENILQKARVIDMHIQILYTI